MPIKILHRPPGDLFTLRLFYGMSRAVDPTVSCIYTASINLELWYNGLPWLEEKNYVTMETGQDFRSCLEDHIYGDTVVLAIKDHLSGSTNSTIHPLEIVEYVRSLITTHSEKKFILITSVENLQYYLSYPNLRIVCWGGDITNQQDRYQALEPVLDKNLDSSCAYISLNRNHRPQRELLCLLLRGMKLDFNGLISCMFKSDIGNNEFLNRWNFLPEHDHIVEIAKRGSESSKEWSLMIEDEYDIYDNNNWNDNVRNFDLFLRDYYRLTTVEIVSETTFHEHCYLVTEKTLNSFMGCNFPIILNGAGAVQLLRDIGFDMFDDIVDHSYDLISDPVMRLYTAINNNKILLTDSVRNRDLWKQNVHRFVHNVSVAKTQLYKYYTDRCLAQFRTAINE